MDRYNIPAISLRVAIILDVDAADYKEAAEHQDRIQAFLDSLKQIYPSAELSFRQRRNLAHREPSELTSRSAALRLTSDTVRSGRLHEYE